MIGHIIPDSIYFGRHIWINYEGSAIADSEDPELYRNLYAKIADKWVQYGCFNHFVIVPSGNFKVIDAWLRLGFAYQQAHGLYELANENMKNFNYSGIKIRLATKSDIEAVKNICSLNFKHQTGAPVWAIGLPEEVMEIENGYAELIDDKNTDFWLAFSDDKLVGFQCYMRNHPGETKMMIPEDSVELVAAGTVPEERNKGINTLLTINGFLNAKRNGFKYCITDWRVTNLLSSMFWPKQGFRPIAFRLTRAIDSRIVWANGRRRLDK